VIKTLERIFYDKPAKAKAKSKEKSKPKTIEDCKTKSEIKKFTIAEIKDWLRKRGVSLKKISELHKEDFVNIAWKTKNSESESESESDSESDSDSDSESDSE
jgi:hypothetical protein